MRNVRVAAGIVVALTSLAAVYAQGRFSPAKYLTGVPPSIQIRAVGGGQVLVAASIDESGNVREITTLRDTPPFTEAVRNAIVGWKFAPAHEDLTPGTGAQPNSTKNVKSKVLIAALFRPPTLNAPSFGEVPKDVAAPSDEMPFPIAIVEPAYPAMALFDGEVLVELSVGSDGRVLEGKVLRSAPPFDQPALDAGRRWTFRPARVDGVPVPSFAYITFGFRQPVTPSPK